MMATKLFAGGSATVMVAAAVSESGWVGGCAASALAVLLLLTAARTSRRAGGSVLVSAPGETMSAIAEHLAQALADDYLAAEKALTRLEASAKAYQKELGTEGAAIPPVTWTAIRGDIAGAAAAVARSHLAITIYDVRPRPMDGGGK